MIKEQTNSSRIGLRAAWAATALIVLCETLSAARQAEGLSPGLADEFVAVEWRCPTFTWSLVRDAEYTVVITPVVPESREPAENAEPTIRRFPAGATSWTLSGSNCLKRGQSYTWSVTATVPGQASTVSQLLLFTVPVAPSTAELWQALEILQAAGSLAESSDRSLSGLNEGIAVPRGVSPSSAIAGETTATEAGSAGVAGHASGPSGNTHGVVGTNDSPDGSGVTAANLNPEGGADLVLDGTAQGAGDTVMTESSLLVGGPAYDLTNAGSDLNLLINGVSAVTSDNDADTLGNLSCSPDDVAIWNGAAWECRCLDQQPCYSGAPGTQGVGICQAGTTNCALGSGSTCEEEVLPGSETGFCNGLDDDCNGIVDDGGCGECILFGLGAHVCNDESEACYLSSSSNLLICAPEGNALPGEACQFVNDCQQGSACVPVDGKNLACATYCDFPDNDPDLCDIDEICEQLHEDVGICVTP